MRSKILASLLLPTALAAQSAPLTLKHDPKPTSGPISAADLMTRLYIFADDSMLGRETGTLGEVKASMYIAGELKKLGLKPAGDSGGFLQYVPMVRRALDTLSTIVVDGTVLRAGVDFLAQSRSRIPVLSTVQVVYGGRFPDTTVQLTAEQVRGKLIIQGDGPDDPRTINSLGRSPAFQRQLAVLREGLATVAILDSLSPQQIRQLTRPRDGDVFMRPDSTAAASISIAVTRRAAKLLLGGDPDSLSAGAPGRSVTMNIVFRDTPVAARNVVAILPGTDRRLKDTYVAMGAHLDHVGISQGRPADHDSLHLRNAARFAIVGMVSRGQQQTPEQRARVDSIRVNVDSIRALRPLRPDSIRNGADDDGSGSVTLLELAESFARAAAKPKRSLLFVWHTGEEKGLLGSRWYSNHPTVPRDSIVAQLNMDMVGRGEARDYPIGSATYLQLVGSRRLSTELGEMVEEVNRGQKQPFTFDYSYDAPGHPENIYCRSDHFHYARWGIPVVFFTTGLHGDYHQVTDEPQYIAYDHMARVGQLVRDIAARVANSDKRPQVDGPRMEPTGVCRQ
jgi:peptidase M28-like protein